jgi:superfamily II DNA helicase RecQ
VAPEQLNNESSIALIRSVPLALLAIDEAHCISGKQGCLDLVTV